jgi:UDP-2,3-diacylglucosamine hydrolase
LDPNPVDFARFEVPPGWRAVDFISDLHLDESHPRTFDAFARHLLETPADAVFLLGDIFEAWVGDDAADEPGSFEARCAALLREAADRRSIAFMAGNRDFLVGSAFLSRTGLARLHDPTRAVGWGGALLLTHGDALCLADTGYQQFRAMVREPAWQAQVLARPLAERRVMARQMRQMSEPGRPEDGADVDGEAAAQWLRRAGTGVMVHGHTHRPGASMLGEGLRREVLSDWDLDGPQPRAEVMRWSAAGLQRLSPAAALAPLPD